MLEMIGTWELVSRRGVERKPGKVNEPSALKGFTFWNREVTMDRQPHR